MQSAAAAMEQEVVQNLQDAGILQFATDVCYLESALPNRATTSSPAGPVAAGRTAGQHVSEDAQRAISEAAHAASAAESELQSSRKRLASMLKNNPGSRNGDAGMDSKGRKSARTAADNYAGRGSQNKGLRHFAMQVCNKIEAKGRTTYNEVADELVIELKDQPDAGGDDKNIRRRVYDAFNVLLAVGIIGREGKKEIVWKGFPGSNSLAMEQAHAERARRLQAVEKKQKELQELIEQHSMVSQLLEVNPVRGPNDPGMALQIPFVLVRAKPETSLEVSVSEDMQKVDFKFDSQFSLHDDSFVLQQIIQHYGSIRGMLQPAGECAASS